MRSSVPHATTFKPLMPSPSLACSRPELRLPRGLGRNQASMLALINRVDASSSSTAVRRACCYAEIMRIPARPVVEAPASRRIAHRNLVWFLPAGYTMLAAQTRTDTNNAGTS